MSPSQRKRIKRGTKIATIFPIKDPDITPEEVRRKVFSTKLWKAPG